MGLDDLTDEVEEEVHALSEEEIEDFIDRFTTVSENVVSLDKRVEGLEDQMDALETLLEVLVEEYKRLDDTQRSDFLEEETEEVENDEGDNTSAWRTD